MFMRHMQKQVFASIRFDDPTINIQWPIAKEQMLLSPKDQKGKLFEEAELFE